jgi:hypothetical protein
VHVILARGYSVPTVLLVQPAHGRNVLCTESADRHEKGDEEKGKETEMWRESETLAMHTGGLRTGRLYYSEGRAEIPRRGVLSKSSLEGGIIAGMCQYEHRSACRDHNLIHDSCAKESDE